MFYGKMFLNTKLTKSVIKAFILYFSLVFRIFIEKPNIKKSRIHNSLFKFFLFFCKVAIFDYTYVKDLLMVMVQRLLNDSSCDYVCYIFAYMLSRFYHCESSGDSCNLLKNEFWAIL
jgi:hypothetical protein